MSKEFKVGDKVRLNQGYGRFALGQVGTVQETETNAGGAYWQEREGDLVRVLLDDGRTVEAFAMRFDIAESAPQYKAGDKVRITYEGWTGSWAFGSECTVKDYWGAETLVLIGACGNTGHVCVDQVELVAEPTPYYLVSSPVQKFDTPHATKDAAKEWITEYGTPGVEYKLHRVYDEGTFSVVRELKEAA